MYSFLVILAMVIFGGLLALLGDRVGMKVGKKRLSIFGLRPKYTSMIITVFTGIVIAGLTLLALTVMSEYARTAIFELRTIQAQLKSSTKRVTVLSGRIMQKESEYQTLTAKHLETRKNLEKVIQQKKLVEEAKKYIEKQKAEVEFQVNELQKLNDNLQISNKELENRSLNMSKILDEFNEQLSVLRLEEERYKKQIENYEGMLSKLQDQQTTIVSKPILFYVGEILVAKVVEPVTNTDKIYEKLIEPILQEANEVAFDRGARIPGSKNYALRVSSRRVGEVCAQLAESKIKSVVRVIVEKNSVIEDPVTVRIEIYPNQRIFNSDEIITEAEVSSEIPESELRDRLFTLLIVANNKAIDKGIISTGQNLRDVISIQEVARLIGVIKENRHNRYRVMLKAMNDIYRVDQLKLKFELELLKE